MQKVSTRSSLGGDLTRLGLSPGALVMVHAALRSVGPITGGVNVLVQALQDVVGPEGTLMAYADFEPFYEDSDEVEVPVFDKRIARAARDYGVLPETLRTWPGALRSDHPDAGAVAIGAQAEWLTRDHPFQQGYGRGTPFEKALQAGVQVLTLGSPLDRITLLHYAEFAANIPDKRMVRYRRRMPGPDGPEWVDFEEFDTGDPVNSALPENCFEQIAEAYLASGRGRTGSVGNANSALFDGPDLVQFGINWLEAFFRADR